MEPEIYIPILVGLISGVIGLVGGMYLKTLEFNLNKEALRDRKFLEGKISAIHEYIEYEGEVIGSICNCIVTLKARNFNGFQVFYDRFLKARFNYQGKTSKLLFYIEEDSYECIVNFSTFIREFENKVIEILETKFKNIENDITELDFIYEKINKPLEDIKIDLRGELGFKGELVHEVENGGM